MAKKYNYKQYLLRLNPEDPEDATLIARIEEARGEWGGVQRVMKTALSCYHAEQPTSTQSISRPPALLEDLSRAVPNLTSTAAKAMADSPPLRHIRVFYLALEAFTPDALTEIDALLLQAAAERIRSLLEEAAANRQPIRQILKTKGETP